MNASYAELPAGLPAPADDGAADHLPGRELPRLALLASNGSHVDLSRLDGRWVLYVYPMIGRPGEALPTNWNEIPGARGCTPESCAFRDHHAELQSLNTGVLGISAQDCGTQREARDRLHLPFELLGDAELQLKRVLSLPTFEADGHMFFKRLTMIVANRRIEKVFYPIFPPDRHIDEVLAWLE